MSVTNRFPEWGKTGEEPPLGFEYSGGDQVNEKHLNYLWSAIKLQTDDFITKTDALQLQLDNHEAATTAHGADGTVVGKNTLDSVESDLQTDIDGRADDPHGNNAHTETFAVDGDTQPPENHGNNAHTETFAVDGDTQPPENHGNEAHTTNYTDTSPSDVTSSNWGDYEIQKNGTDGNGIINFKT